MKIWLAGGVLILSLMSLLYSNIAYIQTPQPRPQIPQGLVYLGEFAPAIGQDMRYAGSNNFTGKPVTGYDAPECILGYKTAHALSKVNTELLSHGFGLLVLDCYRPSRAVKAFVEWVGKGRQFDKRYYPRVRRSQLIAKGYIASKSSHSSGATVDLTLVKISPEGKLSDVDMGTRYDFLDIRSHTARNKVSAAARQNRMRLKDVMKEYGFSNYHKEWWHFTYRSEPLYGRQFDFPVKARR
jgi:D-alanyl-D-alanine dipeptidase